MSEKPTKTGFAELTPVQRASLIPSVLASPQPKLRAGRSCASCKHSVWPDRNVAYQEGGCYLMPASPENDVSADWWCLQWEGDPLVLAALAALDDTEGTP